jgi:hypothetical protein
MTFDVLDTLSLGIVKCRTLTPLRSLTRISSEWMVQIAPRIFEIYDVPTFMTLGTPISRMSISQLPTPRSPPCVSTDGRSRSFPGNFPWKFSISCHRDFRFPDT